MNSNKLKYFSTIVDGVASASKDPSTKVGALIVDENHRIISTGYNGFVAGCDERYMSQERPLKYHLVIHAEANALLYANRNLKGCILICTHAPCDNCLKHILQSGIREIYYKELGPVERLGLVEKKALRNLIVSTEPKVQQIPSQYALFVDYLDYLNHAIRDLEAREQGIS